MRTLLESNSEAQSRALAGSSQPRRAKPSLLGIGIATPANQQPQQEIADTMAKLWGLQGAALERWERIIDKAGVDTRHAVVPIESVTSLSTAQRMALYEQHAPDLAERAAAEALRRTGVEAGDITDLIIVSCTGFSAPGVDVELMGRLGLRPGTRRLTIGFMGCFGAITGLRAAIGVCAAKPSSVALVVCVELCSLHLRRERDMHNQIASALFADGAAAAIVAGERAASACSDAVAVELETGASLLIPEGADWMTWRVTDTGFAMTLTREVPVAIRRHIAPFVSAVKPTPRAIIAHPGGAGILDAIDAGLDLHGAGGLDLARSVLRRYGNMSSPTVLFVLEEALRLGRPLPALLIAFGPGLTIESMPLASRFTCSSARRPAST